MDSSKTCLSCRFFERLTETSEQGECRRRAPAPVSAEGADMRMVDALWPQVLIEEWCGEWEAKDWATT